MSASTRKAARNWTSPSDRCTASTDTLPSASHIFTRHPISPTLPSTRDSPVLGLCRRCWRLSTAFSTREIGPSWALATTPTFKRSSEKHAGFRTKSCRHGRSSLFAQNADDAQSACHARRGHVVLAHRHSRCRHIDCLRRGYQPRILRPVREVSNTKKNVMDLFTRTYNWGEKLLPSSLESTGIVLSSLIIPMEVHPWINTRLSDRLFWPTWACASHSLVVTSNTAEHKEYAPKGALSSSIPFSRISGEQGERSLLHLLLCDSRLLHRGRS